MQVALQDGRVLATLFSHALYCTDSAQPRLVAFQVRYWVPPVPHVREHSLQDDQASIEEVLVPGRWGGVGGKGVGWSVYSQVPRPTLGSRSGERTP